MSFQYLEPDELNEVVATAVAAGLADRDYRRLLLASVPAIRGYLNDVGAPDLQLRSDLVALNGIERLADGSVPLQLWLGEAANLTAGRVQEAAFRRYQDKVAAEASGQPPLPEPSSLPEVVNNEAIVHEDDMVAVGFLAEGATAGRSVAKLLVPRFDNGVQAFNAAGEPLRASGTGWLITRDLVVTNHHVVNARRDSEANASEDDLRRQAAATTVQFDYDARDAPLTEVAVRQLEAYDPREGLDFAVLRLARPMTDRAPLRLWPRPVTHIDGDYRPVNIIQHPGGNPKSVAFRNNLVTAADDTTIRYFTDTLRGSSGSPVFDDAWTVVALHRGSRGVPNVQFQGRSAAVVNFGTQVKAILDQLQAANPALLAEIQPAVAGGGN
jgi:endonuclease G, mitochondrial